MRCVRQLSDRFDNSESLFRSRPPSCTTWHSMGLIAVFRQNSDFFFVENVANNGFHLVNLFMHTLTSHCNASMWLNIERWHSQFSVHHHKYINIEINKSGKIILWENYHVCVCVYFLLRFKFSLCALFSAVPNRIFISNDLISRIMALRTRAHTLTLYALHSERKNSNFEIKFT